MNYVQALFLLQLHLVRHALTGGKLVAYFLVGFVAMGALGMAVLLSVIFFYLGNQWLPAQSRPIVLVVFNGLILLYGLGWFWGLVMEVQRSDIIDVRKMIHFPVPLWVINAINFVVSLVGFTSAFYLASAMGMVAGIYHNAGQGLLAGLLAVSVFFFLSSAWAYYLRGLLVVWMENKRRRRMLLAVLPLVLMTVGYAPMVLNNLFLGTQGNVKLSDWLNDSDLIFWIERSSFFHPGGFLALAMTSVQSGTGHYWIPVLLMAAFGAWGYYLGFRTTLRYGYGTQIKTTRTMQKKRTGRPPWTARTLPLFHEETTTLATALFLNFVRHPQVRTMLLAPIGLVVLLAVVNGRSLYFGQQLGMPVIALLWPFFMFSGIFFNLFGMDQRGFRTLILLPTPRHRILLAYHLALIPLVGTMGLGFALFGSWYFSLPTETTLVSLLQVSQLFLNFCLVGSFFSIYSPMRIGRNMMRKQQGRVLLVSLLMPFVVGILVIPTALCLFVSRMAESWGLMNYPVGPLLSLVFLATTAAAYPLILRHAGDLLMLREQRILATLIKSSE